MSRRGSRRKGQGFDARRVQLTVADFEPWNKERF